MNFSKNTVDRKKYILGQFQLFMPALLQGLAWPLGRSAMGFFAHLTIEGKENLKKAQEYSSENKVGIILAVNHTSELDFLFPLVAIPPFSNLFPMFYVAHARAKYNANTGLSWRRYIYSFPAFLTSWGAYPYIADQKDYSKSMPYHEQLLSVGRTVCIFPEGKIQKDGTRKEAKGGIAYLAEATGALIIPIHVSGAAGMSVSQFFHRERRITISYLKPVHIETLIDLDQPVPQRYKDAAQKIMSITV